MHQRNQQRTKNNRVVQKCTKTLLYQNMRYNSGKAPESRRFRGFLPAEIISDSRFWAGTVKSYAQIRLQALAERS